MGHYVISQKASPFLSSGIVVHGSLVFTSHDENAFGIFLQNINFENLLGSVDEMRWRKCLEFLIIQPRLFQLLFFVCYLLIVILYIQIDLVGKSIVMSSFDSSIICCSFGCGGCGFRRVFFLIIFFLFLAGESSTRPI